MSDIHQGIDAELLGITDRNTQRGLVGSGAVCSANNCSMQKTTRVLGRAAFVASHCAHNIPGSSQKDNPCTFICRKTFEHLVLGGSRDLIQMKVMMKMVQRSLMPM